jgi:DNA primase
MGWAEKLAKNLAARNPKLMTVERRLAEREKSQVYLDWQQNARGKTIASLGITVKAPVSCGFSEQMH